MPFSCDSYFVVAFQSISIFWSNYRENGENSGLLATLKTRPVILLNSQDISHDTGNESDRNMDTIGNTCIIIVGLISKHGWQVGFIKATISAKNYISVSKFEFCPKTSQSWTDQDIFLERASYGGARRSTNTLDGYRSAGPTHEWHGLYHHHSQQATETHYSTFVYGHVFETMSTNRWIINYHAQVPSLATMSGLWKCLKQQHDNSHCEWRYANPHKLNNPCHKDS